MNENEILMCVIALVLGYLFARMMRGNGFEIGADAKCDTELFNLCSNDWKYSKLNCYDCAGRNQQALEAANCIKEDFTEFCESATHCHPAFKNSGSKYCDSASGTCFAANGSMTNGKILRWPDPGTGPGGTVSASDCKGECDKNSSCVGYSWGDGYGSYCSGSPCCTVYGPNIEKDPYRAGLPNPYKRTPWYYNAINPAGTSIVDVSHDVGGFRCSPIALKNQWKKEI